MSDRKTVLLRIKKIFKKPLIGLRAVAQLGGILLDSESYGQLTNFNFDCVAVGILKRGSKITKNYKLGIMLDPTDYQRKFDFRAFGDQFFVRKSDSLEINNQINNDLYKPEIAKLRDLYKEFCSRIPDRGKQAVVSHTENTKGKK